MRFATAACMQKYGNASFATVACAKCMRYGGRGGDPYHGGGGGGGNTGHGTIYIYIYLCLRVLGHRGLGTIGVFFVVFKTSGSLLELLGARPLDGRGFFVIKGVSWMMFYVFLPIGIGSHAIFSLFNP